MSIFVINRIPSHCLKEALVTWALIVQVAYEGVLEVKLAWHFYSVMMKSGRVTIEMELLLQNISLVLLVFQDLEISLRLRIYIDRCST